MWHIIPLRGIKCKSDTADIVSYYNIANINIIVYNIVHIDNKIIFKEEDNNEYYDNEKF